MTVGEMLDYTNRLKEILSSRLPADVRFMRLDNLMMDVEDAYVNDEFASRLYLTAAEYKEVS